jgi:hypothetical protein
LHKAFNTKGIVETITMEKPMHKLSVTLLCCFLTAGAYAQTTPATPPACKSQAADKKLAGAALTSFMKKCEADAQTACDTSAADKKLSGAAKTSFTKKCVTDAVGG